MQDEQFAMVLEACCRRVRQGELLERCLADYPASYRAELARLVPVTQWLSGLAESPSPAFQARLEQQLLASLDEARRERRRGLLERARALLMASPATRLAATALVLLFVAVGGGVGAVRASEDSLPDSPLYPVKAARESLQLVLAPDDEAKVGVHGEQLAARGRELDQAVQARKPRVVETLAARVAWSTDRIVDQALAARARGNPLPARRADAALALIRQRLDRVIRQAPPESRDTLTRLAEFLAQQQRRLETRS